MDTQDVQSLIASGKVLTCEELKRLDLISDNLQNEFDKLDPATQCGHLVAAGESSYSVQYLPVTAEQVALTQARVEWFRRAQPSAGYYNAFRSDGTLLLDGYLTMKEYFDRQGVPADAAALI